MRFPSVAVATTVAVVLIAGVGSAAAATPATPATATPSAATPGTATRPAVGTALSDLALLQIAAAGHHVVVGNLALTSSTVAPAGTARLVLTPLTADGTAYGQQTITPANSPVEVPVLSTTALPAAISRVLTAQSPVLRVSVADAPSGPTASIAASSLGALSVLGLPIALAGTVHNATEVTSTGAASVKQVSLQGLALPSIGAVLAGLGLDVTAVPVSVLNELLTKLGLSTAALRSATGAAATAQQQVTAATTALTGSTAGFATATSTLTRLLGAMSIPTYAALPEAGRSGVEATNPGTAAAYADYVAKGDAAGLAQAALTAAQATLAATTATATGLLRAALDGTPLLSVAALTATTSAVSKSAQAGGQQAVISGGQLTGLKVFGTDVLLTALGSSTVDLTALTSTALASVNTVVTRLTSTFTSVLATVPGLTLSAPRVDLLTKRTATDIVAGFGLASTALHALTITLPTIVLPAALALPGAAGLPAFAGQGPLGGVLRSAAGSVGLLTLSEQTSFRPARAATVTPPAAIPLAAVPAAEKAPQLPRTGPAAGVSALALLLIVGAAALRRRFAA